MITGENLVVEITNKYIDNAIRESEDGGVRSDTVSPFKELNAVRELG